MTTDLHTFRVPIEDIAFDSTEVARLLGYPESAPKAVAQTVDSLYRAAQPHVLAQCGYQCFTSAVSVETDSFCCGDVTFACGKRIGRHLKGCTGVAFFAATLGQDFQDWSKVFFEQNDPYQGYLCDTVGSVLVESLADLLELKLQQALDQQGLQRSNRLSPGYCQWPVAEQQKLFGLLPNRFCGITLTESSLMIPIKSVSGVIGFGPSVKRLDYGCNLCDMQNCIMRRQA